MRVVEPADYQPKDNPHGVEVWGLLRKPEVQISRIELAPGRRLKLHRTPVDALFYVLAGRGTVTVGEEEREVAAGCLIDSPARIPHTWRNEGGEPLSILVIKTPAQSEPTEFLE